MAHFSPKPTPFLIHFSEFEGGGLLQGRPKSVLKGGVSYKVFQKSAKGGVSYKDTQIFDFEGGGLLQRGGSITRNSTDIQAW